ncbi:peptidoglycan-binding domain-containing protein [Mesorhizobium mediterraneum]|uniref:peptidoglycan-binding domain-containing protein n=1 Tax=Mesorhizobium mediterraneum TaxID=43617 RepID=UPI001AEE7E5F|nr:peptidoglycan-binding protein [Mesorhizobium mediterraneum]
MQEISPTSKIAKQRASWTRLLPAAVAVAAALMLPAMAEPFPASGGKALTLEQRIAMDCREEDAASFAQPTEVLPTPEVPFELTYSQGNDLVRLSGEETEAYVALGAGDDLALLHHVGAGMAIRGDSGADILLLCSMEDLQADFTPGTENLARDDGQDVIIIESAVFTSVPVGMRRNIMIHGFDTDADRVVIRAPRQLMESREVLNIGGVRIGDVLIAINAAFGARKVDFDGDEVIFVVDDGHVRAQGKVPQVNAASNEPDPGAMLETFDKAGQAATVPQRAPAQMAGQTTPKITVAWAPGCEFLELEIIGEPTEMSGLAPADGIVCYAIKPNAGSEISIEVAEGRNVVFSVSGLVDAVDRYAFRASGYGYQINVVQLMRSASSEPYRIVIRGSESTQPRTEPPAPIEAGLRKKVMNFLGEGDALAKIEPNGDREIDIKPVDLNGDGMSEVLVIVRSSLDCGSRGCAGYVLDLSGPEAVSRGDFIANTLDAAESKTNGWRDILLDGQRFIYRSGKYVHAGKSGTVGRLDQATIRAVQQKLALLGFDPGPVDGAYGRKTKAAIQAFLASQGLEQETGMGESLLAALETAAKRDSQGARGTVVRIYTQPSPDSGMLERGRRKQHLSPRLVDLIEAAEKGYFRRYGEYEIDINPIVPGQDYELADLSISAPEYAGERAKVTVRLTNRLTDPDRLHELRYELIRSDDSSWLIDDIVTDGSAFSAALVEYSRW